ncbi:hypothetical protein [Lampropedia puyangensis]|nr:hypothetical protein [Lampropedia puyangensis]
MFYMLFKSLHIFVAIAWLLGLLVCGVLLRTRDMSAPAEQQYIFNSRIALIARNICLWWVMPVMTLALIAGIYMTVVAGWWHMHWVFIKLSCAALLVVLAIFQARTARLWQQNPMVLPPSWLGLGIPLTLVLGIALLYLAFSKPI